MVSLGAESHRFDLNSNSNSGKVRSLGSVATSLPSYQEVSGSISEFAVGFFFNGEIFLGMYD